MDGRPLQHALEAGGRLGILAVIADQTLEFGLDVIGEVAAQFLDVHTAGAQNGDRVLIVGQSKQEMLQGGELVMSFVRQREGTVKALFQVCG